MVSNDLTENINKSMKQVSILFTDIEDSTAYWDQFGDIKGRLMLDQHNRLLFPIIKRFNGVVVKTIGDGIMARFKSPDNSLRAGIAIQQAMERMRKQDQTFHVKIRIGIHTGMAIVEEQDVYGDMVNVAARLANFAKGSELVISSTTVDKLKKGKKYLLYRKGEFTPKGKRKSITIYSCRWNDYKRLISSLKFSSGFKLEPREKGDIAAYFIIAMLTLGYLYHEYIRYIIVELDPLLNISNSFLFMLNPVFIFKEYEIIGKLGVLFLLLVTLFIMKIKTISYFLIKILQGGFWFSIIFFIVHMPISYFNINYGFEPGQEIYRSKYEFVKIIHDKARLIPDTGFNPTSIQFLNRGSRFALAEGSVVQGGTIWQKVHVEKSKYGWIRNDDYSPIWIQQLAITDQNRFYFRFFDLCAVVLAFGGFVLGFSNFNIRPT